MSLIKKIIIWFKGLKNPKPSIEPALPLEPIEKELNHLDVLLEIEDLLITEAMKWVGIREHGGANKGNEVEMFQKAVDGKAQGEPWCLAFVQFVVGQVCKNYDILNPLVRTEHCQTLYNRTDKRYLRKDPERGFIFILKSKTSSSGHTGFCLNRGSAFETVEGNTNASGSREGDGVYVKTRVVAGTPTMDMRGFIDVPAMIYDRIKLAKNSNSNNMN